MNILVIKHFFVGFVLSEIPIGLFYNLYHQQCIYIYNDYNHNDIYLCYIP